MLVLSRKEGQSVMIGENIKVTILQIEGRNIRLGFEAPKDIEIHREEIFNKIQKIERKVPESDE
jgi:carbon storage regulator